MSPLFFVYSHVVPITLHTMKRFFIISVILAFFGFISCQKNEAEAIIGSWKATSLLMNMGGMEMEMDISKSGVQIDVLFKADGTGAITGSAEGEAISTDFEYSVSDGMLSLTAEDNTITAPVTINGKKMSLVVDGEIIEQSGTQVTINFTRN